VVTDALLAPLLALCEWLVGSLPAGEPFDVPALATVWEWVARVDSVLPVLGLVEVAVGLLAAVVGFFLVRMVLVVRHVLLP
jgi:hypothetical protein